MKTILSLVFGLLVIALVEASHVANHTDTNVTTPRPEVGYNYVEECFVFPEIREKVVILQRNGNCSVNFNRSWEEYKYEFGEDGSGSMWRGLHGIHHMTRRFDYSLRVEVKTNDTWYFANYRKFYVDSEENQFRLHISGYGGDAGDSFTNTTEGGRWNLDGMPFTVPLASDTHSASNCSANYGGGWWHNQCYMSCLTCPCGDNFAWDSLNHLESNGVLQMASMVMYRY